MKQNRTLRGRARSAWSRPGALACCFLLLAGNATLRASEIRVTDFGGQPDSRRNAAVAVHQALEACRKLDHPTLIFPRGRYDFWPNGCVQKDYFESNTTANNPKRLGISIEGFNGLTVDRGGSTFVFHDRLQPFTVDHYCLQADCGGRVAGWPQPRLGPLVVKKAATFRGGIGAGELGLAWLTGGQAQEVVNLWTGLISVSSSPIGPAIIQSDVGYHLRPVGHSLEKFDWERFLEFADYHFKRQETRK